MDFNVASANDKILGMIFGAAIGDRFAAEGGARTESQHLGQLIAMLRSTADCGMVSIAELSHKLMAWKNGVAAEISAPFTDPFSIRVIEHKVYAIDPIFAAHDILRAAEAEASEKIQRVAAAAAAPAADEEKKEEAAGEVATAPSAAGEEKKAIDTAAAAAASAEAIEAWAASCLNAPLLRAAIAGIFKDSSDYSAAQCACTHIDPRVVAACVLISSVVRSRIIGAYSGGPPAHLSEVIPEALMSITAPGKLNVDHHISDIIAHSSRHVCEDIAAASLAAAPTSYVFKTMAAGLYAMHQITLLGESKISCPADGFMDILRRIHAAGGDVAGNCAVAGAMMGCEIGYAALPADAAVADRAALELVSFDFLRAFSLIKKEETSIAAILASVGAPPEAAAVPPEASAATPPETSEASATPLEAPETSEASATPPEAAAATPPEAAAAAAPLGIDESVIDADERID